MPAAACCLSELDLEEAEAVKCSTQDPVYQWGEGKDPEL